jgi:hypothetical protein
LLRLGVAAATAPVLTWLLAAPVGRDLFAVMLVAAAVPAALALILARPAAGRPYLATGLAAVAGTVVLLTTLSVTAGSDTTPEFAVVLVMAVYAVPGLAGLALVALGAQAWRAPRTEH